MTPDQASIVGAALAEFGPPPVGSYQIILASSTTTAAAGTTSTGTTGTTTGTGTGTTSIGPAYPAPSNLHQTVYPTQASLAANDRPERPVPLAGPARAASRSSTRRRRPARRARSTRRPPASAPKTAYQWRVAVDQSGTNKASAWSNGSFTTT